MSSLIARIENPEPFFSTLEIVGHGNRIGKVCISQIGLTLTLILQEEGENLNTSMVAKVNLTSEMFDTYTFEDSGRKYAYFDWNFLLNESSRVARDIPIELSINCSSQNPRFVLRYMQGTELNQIEVPILNDRAPIFVAFPRGVGLRIALDPDRVIRILEHAFLADERLRISIHDDALIFRYLNHPLDIIYMRLGGGNRVTGRGSLVVTEIELSWNSLIVIVNAVQESTQMEIRVPPVQPPRPVVFTIYNGVPFVEFVVPPHSQANVQMRYRGNY